MASSLLAEYLLCETVVLDQDLTSKKRVFEQVGLLLENLLGIARSVVFDSLFAREKLGSTALGQGVALPHGRIKGLKKPVLVFLRPREGVLFDAPDNQPVSLIFALLVPMQATDVHLQLLSELAQLLSDRNIRQQLTTLSEPQAVCQLIAEWQPYA